MKRQSSFDPKVYRLAGYCLTGIRVYDEMGERQLGRWNDEKSWHTIVWLSRVLVYFGAYKLCRISYRME